MSLDGVVYVVRLYEVLIDDITIADTGRIAWPQQIGNEKLPAVDGVLVLYDVTDGESVAEIPDILCKSGSTLAPQLCWERRYFY
jgi:hypothetical protein